ncbi:MAG: YD repeat-containing protein, partial [Comamonadaceae bacterium]
MQPRLELVYSSQVGNGSLGMGWGLSGLSTISRCAKERASDGVSESVTYTMSDRYCLNGQHLMLVSGTQGAAGSQYRTEHERFSLITAYGSAGNGPAYFVEKTKSGLTIEYGNSADSRIEAQGKTTPRIWTQNKVSDNKGNYLTVSYTEDSANGDYYASRIDYTGNASASPSLTPGSSVQISYETRPDTETGYQAGSIIKATKRVSNIKTFDGTSVVKDYRLTYEQSTHTQRSRLKTLTECDGA